MTTTYVAFLAAFVLPPLAVLAALRVARWDGDYRRLGGIGVLVVLAMVYTTPWDNYLVARGVWWYGDGTVAASLWHAPVEEYIFVAAQTLLTGLWVQSLPVRDDPDFLPTRRDAAAGLLAGVLVAAVGVAFLARDATFYLGAILAWAAPVLALQWAVGWRYLWARRRLYGVAVAVPTLYLSTIDQWAIADGIWVLADQYTTGLSVLGLPVEEGAFFLVTNVFVTQGLVLYAWVVARWR
ncbi:lycopene cyclase domain-containing protein [Halobacterium jilantaiense]|uniref:Lycopene cyclase domain-containing protein n=1 Tax=Halobacterium jilantaiense TaxID=355548 RepID=A0A1I0PZR9_9EURY|nr:lycopene cyclase domain-containing protein [Halobacterium jilantaiense]SEW20206.1 lycopene cyclase domain-containing protein [Halobacterium jilantaiense]